MRRLISGFAILLFYLLLGLFVAEGAVRVTDAAQPVEPPGWFWQVPDATTGWSLIPNSKGRYYKSLYEFDVRVSINRMGLRGSDSLAYEKPDGVYRGLVLGDSFVEALHVEFEESFPQQLGRLMHRETGQQVEVINAGVHGWGNDQQLIWLQEEGYKYQPDLILLAVYPRNDFENNTEALEAADHGGAILKPFFGLEDDHLVRKYYPYDPNAVPRIENENVIVQPEPVPPGPLTGAGEWLFNHSALYRYTEPRLRAALPRFAASLARTGIIKPGAETKLLAQGPDYVPLAYHVYEVQPDEFWQTGYDVTAAIFAEFQRTATGMGAATAALLITAPEQVNPEEWTRILQKYPRMQQMELSLDISHQRAEAMLRHAGVPTLDSLAHFPELNRSGPRLHIRSDGHWTPAGHETAARLLFNFLGDQGIVPFLQGRSVPVTVPVPGRSPWEWFVLLVALAIAGSLVWDVFRTGPGLWGRKAIAGLSTTGELLGYMARRRQYALLPLVVVLLMFAGLLILAQASVVGPFIYTLI